MDVAFQSAMYYIKVSVCTDKQTGLSILHMSGLSKLQHVMQQQTFQEQIFISVVIITEY